MANALYPKYKEALLSASTNVSLVTGTVKAVLIDLADYTYSAAHDFLDDIPAAAREGCFLWVQGPVPRHFSGFL